jgi:hypothetical protein
VRTRPWRARLFGKAGSCRPGEDLVCHQGLGSKSLVFNQGPEKSNFRLPQGRLFVLVHDSFLHNEGDVFQQLYIHKGITIHCNHVRGLAWLDGADEVGMAQ